MLIIHDQFQDHGYWLDLDLRHLVESRPEQFRRGPGLEGACLTCLGRIDEERSRNPAASSRYAAWGEIPHSMRSRLLPRLQFMRQLMQAHFPATRVPFLAMTVLDLRNYRREATTGDTQTSVRRPGLWSMPRADTLQFLLRAATAVRVGKV